MVGKKGPARVPRGTASERTNWRIRCMVYEAHLHEMSKGSVYSADAGMAPNTPCSAMLL